jgi:hypothetical protein
MRARASGFTRSGYRAGGRGRGSVAPLPVGRIYSRGIVTTTLGAGIFRVLDAREVQAFESHIGVARTEPPSTP